MQMEGCDPNSAERRVLLVGATNRPEVRSQQLAIAAACAATDADAAIA